MPDALVACDEVATSYDLDSNGQGRIAIKRKLWTPGVDPAVILCNGWSRRAHHVLGGTTVDASTMQLATMTARRGMTVVSHDLCANISGNYLDAWGNAAVIGEVAALKTWAQATGVGNGQAKTGKVKLIGISMGANAALNYAKSLGVPSANISGIALLNPALDPGDIAAVPRDGFLQASIYVAFGGSAGTYASTGGAYNPSLNMAAMGAMGVPIRIWYSNDDTIAHYTKTQAFAAGTANVTLRDCGAHGHLIDDHPMDEIAAWLMDLG